MTVPPGESSNGPSLEEPTSTIPAIQSQNGSALRQRALCNRLSVIRPFVVSCKFLLRSTALAVLCAVCMSIGVLYGMHVVVGMQNSELVHTRAELKGLKELNARVETQQSYLRTVFEDLVVPHEQMRQIQDAPDLKRTPRSRARVWYSIGGGAEQLSPFLREPKQRVPREVPSSLEKSGEALESDIAKLVPKTEEHTLDVVLARWGQLFLSLPLGVPVDGYISSGYGNRISPTSGSSQLHTGVDFAVETQSSVVTTGEGMVREAGYKGAYGLTVVIDHGNGWQSLYGHLSSIRAKVGDRLCRGEVVGLVGSTGNSTGPHLHYEVRRNEVPRNPMPFVEFPRIASLLMRAFVG